MKRLRIDANDTRVRFGPGLALAAGTVEILWPWGAGDRWPDVRAKRIVTAGEGVMP